MRFADPLAHGNDDTLPADHRSKAKGDRDGHFHPHGNELGSAIEVALSSEAL
jgi:hypothetical protein